jgi:RNA recognition motif-containing protein
VDYAKAAEAEEAVKILHGTEFLGRNIRVSMAHSDDDRQSSSRAADGNRCRSLFVANIPPSTSEDKLKEFFEKYGRGTNVRVLLLLCVL